MHYFRLRFLFVCILFHLMSFGMKKDEDPGCRGAVKKTAAFVAGKARELVPTPESGKDLEMGESSFGEEGGYLSTREKKRLILVAAILAASVATGGGAYMALPHDAASSPGKVEPGNSPAIPFTPSPSIPLSPPPSPLVPLTPATPSIPLHPRQKKMFVGMWRRSGGCEVVGVANVSNNEKTVSAKVRAESWDPTAWCPFFTSMNFEKVSCANGDDYKTDAACKVFSPPNDVLMSEAAMIGDNLDSAECRVKCRDDSIFHQKFPYLTSVCVSQKACDTYILSRRPRNACNVNATELDGWKCSFRSEQKFKNQKQNATRPTRERRPKQAKHRGR